MRSIINYPMLDESAAAFSTELDDIIIDSKKLVNAGAGWNYQKFAASFDNPPTVFAQVVNNENCLVFVKDISASGFYYKLKTLSGEEVSDKINFNYQAIDYGGE